MAKYLFIESRDPFDSADVDYFSELVQGTAGRGQEVTLFLLQNGVLATRKGSKHNQRLTQLMKNKVKLMADEFSLRERGIGKPFDGVVVADIDKLVQMILEPGTKAIWH